MAKKLASDKVLFLVVLTLTSFGLVALYSASGQLIVLIRQMVAALLGILALFALADLDYRQLRRPAVVNTVLGFTLFLLAVTLLARPVRGVRRWLFVGGVTLTPSELAKLALVLWLAARIARHLESEPLPLPEDEELPWTPFFTSCVVVTGLVAGLVFAGPDHTMAVYLVSLAVTLLFLAGLPWRFLFFVVSGLALPGIVLAIPGYRQPNLPFLDPERDPLGAGFQLSQSLIAVGSGGLFGLGPGRGVQKLGFLPDSSSSFIYAVVAEELGLVGSLTILVLFLVLLARGVRAGQRAPDAFGRYLAWGLTLIIVSQALIHIGVTLALLPVMSFPLPFFSFGGTSLVVTLAACGVLLNISSHG
jgi:cell division protein FtsW